MVVGGMVGNVPYCGPTTAASRPRQLQVCRLQVRSTCICFQYRRKSSLQVAICALIGAVSCNLVWMHVARFDHIVTSAVRDQFPIQQYLLPGVRGRRTEAFHDQSLAIGEESQAAPVVPFENVTLELEAEQRVESEMLPLSTENLSTSVVDVFIGNPDDSSAYAANETTITSPELSAPHNTTLSWESSLILPQWLKEYTKWHQDQRSTLNEENWDQDKYLIMRCLANDTVCGGASDRLQSIPAKLRIAATSRRLLFIRWERPAKLEEFLLPPSMGLDWRLPDWLYTKLQPLLSPVTPELDGLDAFAESCDSNQALVDTIEMFGEDSGAHWYDAGRQAQEADFATVYHEMWNLLFEPSPPVNALIDEQMNELQLQPMQYDALHMRMVFFVSEVDTPGLIENATNCLLNSFGSPPIPLYVASDNVDAKLKATQYASTLTTNPVVARFSNQTTMHLDRGSDFSEDGLAMPLVAEPYYETFVDLYILSRARCVVYGRGSYGRWANLLSANSSCSMSYFVDRAYNFPPICHEPFSQAS
jgi:hypothetical protein